MSRICLLFVMMIVILMFFVFRAWDLPRVIWFIFLGFLVGLYYGFFNNEIFHGSGKFHNEFEKVHALYIHIVCGIAGSLSLFVLYTRFPFLENTPSLIDASLLIFGILGVVGLLPRAFWFLANSPDIFLKK